ncbi:YqaJ viral recombinase family protein [Massilia antarctica]|uniref:YqaJ viral recombinase family protein n=1 Tax=Massilia antarctica TaxID=2765360 RepID=UPI002271E54F|nr:YqaJ viral recombinase family protein [Massilia sp. H27-R4]MCY0910902.1 YqaJ viral recombinase family protein [Massilia sp. H27-R4]
MDQHALTQGSPEWLAYRATHRNASDAPAMMGVSPYKTRNQLLYEVCTGMVADVDAGTQARFDDGHRFEALARPRAEELVGEGLYPVVGSLGALSASFDGLTICDDVVWEHKTLNDEIRAAETGADLGLHYRIQVEQQLLVAGADKCLFLATKWDANNNPVDERHFWLEPDLRLRAEIIAGWEQFEVDLAEYQYVEILPVVVAAPTMELPALMIQVNGALTLNSNLPMWGKQLTEFIDNINLSPSDDQDFADAEDAVKKLERAEANLGAAEAHALSQTGSIDEMCRAVAMYKELARKTRLMVKKMIDARKEAVRAEIHQTAKDKRLAHIKALNERLGGQYMPDVPADFAGAMKGKRTPSSLKEAADTELARFKISSNAIADCIQLNLNVLSDLAATYSFLFADKSTIALKAPDDFTALVRLRIAEHQRAEEKKADELRARIAQEERVKAEAAAAKAARAAQDEADLAARKAAAVAVEHVQAVREPEPAPRATVPKVKLTPAAAWPQIPRPATEIIDAVVEGMTDDDIVEFGAQHDMEVDELIPRLERFIADARAGALAVAA